MFGWPTPSTSRLARVVALCGLFVVVAPLLTSPAYAQEGDAPDEVVLFVLDLSGSMNEPFDANQTKLDAAKAAFAEAFANVSPDALVGLRTYGDQVEPALPQSRQVGCETDSRLVTPISPLQREQLIEQVQGFTARGDTPVGLALKEAAADIPDGAIGTIVLFSDGRDECFDADLDGDAEVGPSWGEDPCKVAETIATDVAVERIVTVGFSADAAAERELRCIADVSGGSYTPIQTPEDAREVLPELLVQLSAPREAQRLVGREIAGTPSQDGAPEFVLLNTIGADEVLYTDTIVAGEQRWYHMPEYGPDGGTLTATVFGLPAQEGIRFDLKAVVPDLDRTFFTTHGDRNAGIPQRPTASIRCADCLITDGPHELYWVISLTSNSNSFSGTYELEITTAGRGFGGPSTSCTEPQECWYPQELVDRSAELEQMRAEIASLDGKQASADLLARRDELKADNEASQEAVKSAEAETVELTELIATAPEKRTSWVIPLLLMALGVGLAVAPVNRLRRSKAPDSPANEHAGGDSDEAESASAAGDQSPQEAAFTAEQHAAARAQAEQIAAARAAAQHAEQPATEQANAQGEAAPADQSPQEAAFTAEQHAAARAQAEQIAAARAAAQHAEQPATEQANAQGEAAPADQSPQEAAFTAEQHAAARAQAEQIAAARAAAQHAEQPATEQANAQGEAALNAGWYDDPSSPGQWRWWDGTGWTEHTTTGDQGSTS